MSALTFEKNRGKRYIACPDVAQRVGFEPTVPSLVHLISSCSGYLEDKRPYEILRPSDTLFRSDFESDGLPKQRVEKV